MSAPPLNSQAVRAIVDSLRNGRELDRATVRDAVRASLASLVALAPGRSVEVRVPPYGVVQCVPGPRHTRGTPPNVVETDPVTWLEIAIGLVTWHDAVAAGRVQASGARADLSGFLPVVPAVA